MLCLDELELETILEDEPLESGVRMLRDDVSEQMSEKEGGIATPLSYTTSHTTTSIGSREPRANTVSLPQQHFKPGLFGHRRQKRTANSCSSVTSSEKVRKAGHESESDSSDHDNVSEAGSFRSELVLDVARLPPWICAEGAEGMRQSFAENAMDGCNEWCEVHDVNRFDVRSSTYLTDGVKIPAAPSAFTVHQNRIFKTPTAIIHAAQNIPSLSAFLRSHPRSFFLIYNRVVPDGKNSVLNTITVMYRKLPHGEDGAFDTMFDRFVQGNSDFRNQRLKYLYRIREAPNAVHSALRVFGKERPVVIGRQGHMDQKTFSGANYVEIDIDTSASWMARMVVGKILKEAVRIVIEEMLVIEGQSVDELPERPLASWRWLHLTPSECLVDLEAVPPPQPVSQESPQGGQSSGDEATANDVEPGLSSSSRTRVPNPASASVPSVLTAPKDADTTPAKVWPTPLTL